MDRNQQPNETIKVENRRPERVEERPVSRRLQLVALEERVAPNAIWGE
jgi:hypothetical protein